MSADADRELDDRDLEDELSTPEAGEVGLPVDAICCGCKHVRVKRIGEATREDYPNSFTHICQRCQGATWWNVLAVLDVLLDDERRPA